MQTTLRAGLEALLKQHRDDQAEITYAALSELLKLPDTTPAPMPPGYEPLHHSV